MKKINLVLIPSVVRNPVISYFLTEEQRLDQLICTIRSVNEKIPNCHAVVMEGGTYSEEDNKKMLEGGAHEIFNYDLCLNGKRLEDPNRSKSYGEMTLFLEFFNSSLFAVIKDDLLSISKVGGRGILNENFKFAEDDKCVMNYTHTAWSGAGACSGRHWKIPYSLFNHYITQLNLLYENFSSVIDIEHGFYVYNVVPLEGLEPEQVVGISALTSGNGLFEEA